MFQVTVPRAALAALLGFAVSASPAAAQCTAREKPAATKSDASSGLSYAQKKNICYREGSLRKDLSGDQLSNFMQTCRSELTAAKAPSNPRAQWEQRCRTEGESKQNLRGDQLTAFVKKCMVD